MNFTNEQADAIQRDLPGNILVSASAGSGKTRVLVERVIRKIMNGTSIDQLLIVTFTKAAAKEMRDRVQGALQSKINQLANQKNVKLQRHLVRQIRKLPVADISTLDSFCQRIVQNYYYVIDLDPDFRILTDRTEIQLLRDQVWEELREDLYADDKDGQFVRLVDNFSDDRSDDGLTELINKIYDYANVNQDPTKWLENLPKMYHIEGTLTDSSLFKDNIEPMIIDRLQQMILKYKSALEFARRSSDDLSKESEFFHECLENINSVINKIPTLSWNELRTLFNEKPVKGRFPSGKSDGHKQIKLFNDSAKSIWEKQIQKAYFKLDEETNLKVIKDAHSLIKELVKVVLTFSKAYHQLKVQRHGMEFVDIEHAAYQILTRPHLSDAVRENLQNQYQEIMVDEYQDNNRLQDAILQAVAHKNQEGQSDNMFMVGDVKQSIYRFRLGDPSIFMGRQRSYQNPDNDNYNIDLADNFRSAENIDNFVNLIFTQIMNQEVGEIDYTGAAKLKFGAKYYPKELTSNVEVDLYDANNTNNDEPIMDEQFQVNDADHGQLELVAQKIDDLIRNQKPVFDKTLGKNGEMRPIKYSDIAILSATRSQNLILTDVFQHHKIPVTVTGQDSYFKTTEIQIMMSLLRIIDNPYQDIPLVAVLRSPIVGLDENQLAYIRINRNTGDYYHAVRSFVGNYDNFKDEHDFGSIVFHKIEQFLNQLDDFRNYAHHHELVDLIWYIYQKTGFLDYVGGMPAGKQRQANLHALYQRAADYEQTSFKGLFQFVRFIERMQKHDQDLSEPVEIVDDDTVSVMTIHGSKGLEFPVVFLIDIQRQFNTMETKQRFVLNDKMGLGIDYIDQDKRTKITTLPKRVVLDQIQSENQAEEMRKLYVALTRAEQQLFLVGIAKKRSTSDSTGKAELLKQWREASFSPDIVLDASLRNEKKSNLGLIGTALYRHPQFLREFEDERASQLLESDKTQFTINFYSNVDLEKGEISGDNNANANWMKNMVKEPVNTEINIDDIKRIMNFEYPNQVATHTTAYQSVSEVKRLFDDPDAGDMGLLIGSKNGIKQGSRYVNPNFAQPRFLQSVTKPTPAEVGTATHLVLQKIDVTHKPTENEIEELIERLVNEKLIVADVAKQIERSAIMNFFDSKVGELILQHPDRIHREVPFSLLLSAADLFADMAKDGDEKVLIHGIIDGYLVLDDQIILFDYKTDYINPRQIKAGKEKLLDKYRGQVNLYALALTKIMKRPITKKYLYSLSIGRLIPISN